MKWERRITIAVLFLLEIVATAVVTSVAAAVVIPLAYKERGCYAIGGEWLVLLLITIAAYTLINNAVFQAAEKRGGKKTNERNKGACRKVSGNGNQLGVVRDGITSRNAQARMDYQQRGRC